MRTQCHTTRLAAALAAVLVALAGVAHVRGGVVVFEHAGAADPTSESWIRNATGGTLEGPTNDGGTLAWFIDDNTNGAGFIFYSQIPTDNHLLSADAIGWTLRVFLRVVDTPDPVRFSVFVGFDTDTVRHSLGFGSEADGDPIVQLWDGGFSGTALTGASFTLQGGGSGYHLYELVFDPTAGSADLFIDGIERLSNYPGHTNGAGSRQVAWGAGDSFDTGEGRYGLVQLELARLSGDMNCDGDVDVSNDLPLFIDALLDPTGYTPPLGCTIGPADMNGDGTHNGLDIAGFVVALLQ